MERSAATIMSAGKWTRISTWALGVFLLLMFIIGFWASREPEIFWVNRSAEQESAIVGFSTVDTLIRVAETLLDKNGGYQTNDKLPPFVVLDNIPSWELGVVNQIRDLGRVMRDDYTRSQSQSKEDPDVAEGSPKFFYDNNSWIFPTTESEYKEGIRRFTAYRDRLAAGDPDTVFYARADNLREWLSQVEKRLGSLSQRLSASVGQVRFNTDLAGDADAVQSTETSKQLDIKTPWSEIDDVFYETRGASWALIHFFKAVELDFKPILDKKNASISLQQIIRELEASQETLWSPMIMNGSGFGLFANHSLVMGSYISRANAAVIDLRNLLEQG